MAERTGPRRPIFSADQLLAAMNEARSKRYNPHPFGTDAFWSHELRAGRSPWRDGLADGVSAEFSFKESFRDAGKEIGKEGRIFLKRGYLAVSEEPEVAIATAQLRREIEAERRAFWKIGSDGMRVYDTGWCRDGGPARLAAAKAKLRRRVERVLRVQIAEAEGSEAGLW